MTFSKNGPDFIDLRKEIADCLEHKGYWALLRRPVDGRRVGEFDPQTREGLTYRELAQGKGFKDDWIRIRRMTLFDIPEEPGSIGREAAPLIRFYMKHGVKPDVHDFILEVALDEESMCRGSQIQPNAPIDVVKVFDIQEVTPMREHGGRIEFWQVFALEAFVGDLG